ncbi:1-acyl-sn-glycerol-3-phosphate acyltransferase [Nitrosomonas sp. Nm51]|uniref:lysophospholipid acyltransferase family protein n=1 Tax=Nitrosomonas sp. Nm51 TaxID=133720 RepID=UPI0008D5C792|nr:lysophospholipid acyltransferase family protein [Nitrosomonas sp. Nm51]SEQ76871.1 1-acyl-sn-glycerol-3-phosphate acyltransferase [Nitrosomonas sp. Nm51]
MALLSKLPHKKMKEKATPPIVRLFRLVRLLLQVVSGILQSIVYPYCSRSIQQRMMKNWAKGTLKTLNITINVIGSFPNRNHQRALLIANHVSWLDICAVMAVCPTQFVAKSEIRNWPVIGFLSKRVGTHFIERAKRSDTARLNQELGNVLIAGERVCIFPEGGTSDGTQTLHFHASLLQSAINAQALLYPVAIRYLDTAGSICHDAAYTDISLAASLRKVLCQPRIEAVLNCNAPIYSAEKNRRELARMSEEAINRNLSQPAYHSESEKPSYLPNA